MNKAHAFVTAVLAALSIHAAEPPRLSNDKLALRFDAASGALVAVENKLTGETYGLRGDLFAVEAVEFHAGLADAKLTGLKADGNVFKASYETKALTIQVKWTLWENFAEKQLTLISSREYGLTNLVVSRPTFSGGGLQIVDYRHPKTGLNKGMEPTHTYFGRTAKGGIFTGVEMPFDTSSVKGQQVVLGYAPNLKVKANEAIACEPIYLGVYRQDGGEKTEDGYPLPSESDAMVDMTSILLPPQNRRLGPIMCGWWSECLREGYRTPSDAKHDMRSIDFASECGIDNITPGYNWDGNYQKLSAERDDSKARLDELPLQVVAYAHKKGVRWMLWPTMGSCNPWEGFLNYPTMGSTPWAGVKPLRWLDKPEWQVPGHPAACFAYQPAFDWLLKTMLGYVQEGQYGAWCLDGDFFGEPGFGGGPGYNGAAGPNGEPKEEWVHPARCLSKVHDHLNPDINYICQRNLTEMARVLRQRHPDLYMFYCRPAMDLGVWALRYVDSCFTINEWAALEGIPGMGAQPKNVMLGDKIRYWSRVRVRQNFFPHYLDSPLVFDAPKSMSKRDWTSDKIDYIMLSALSSSPNQTYYLPSQEGIPGSDKTEIKKWLDWGRANLKFIMVRKDLAAWPAPGKVDGSAHIVGDRGLVFLFNPNKSPRAGEFAATTGCIGLKGEGKFSITQEYPSSAHAQTARYGDMIEWDIPAQTAVILRIQPASG